MDAQTRRDLELFRTRSGAQGIFEVLDLTRTQGGSGALRRRFENPLSHPREIREVQESVRFLLNGGAPARPPAELVEGVGRYSDSSWAVASRARGLRLLVDTAVVRLRYRALYRFVREGILATDRLLEWVRREAEEALGRHPPSLVRRHMEELLSLAGELGDDGHRRRRDAVALVRRDQRLRKVQGPTLHRLLEVLHDLEALHAMAAGTRKFGLVLPEVLDSEELGVAGEGLFHLFLDDPVRNPVRLSSTDRLMFLTGPNMAGKTTYLKALAIAVYLAHLGTGVPARAFRFTPLGAVYTSLSPEESIREGLSYFMAEVRRVKSVAAGVARDRSALVVFDEVFRGTNVRDALDASLMVIRGFARNVRCLSLFSSHLVELADGLASEPGVKFVRFEGEVEDGRAVYGFRLEEGVSSQRLGLRLLEQEGVPGLLGMAGE